MQGRFYSSEHIGWKHFLWKIIACFHCNYRKSSNKLGGGRRSGRLFKNILIFCGAYSRDALVSKLNEKRTERMCHNLLTGGILENVVEIIFLFLLVYFSYHNLKIRLSVIIIAWLKFLYGQSVQFPVSFPGLSFPVPFLYIAPTKAVLTELKAYQLG